MRNYKYLIKTFKFFWDCLAVVGLLSILGYLLLFSVLIIKTDLSVPSLAGKIVKKGITVLSPNKKGTIVNDIPKIDPDSYTPVKLSPYINIKPVDERLFSGRRILKVGPKRSLKAPGEAAKIAKFGDIIEIDAGIYIGDIARWKTNNLMIRGVGGRAILDADGKSMDGKAIWVIQANDIIIENIGFKNCKVKDRNGAGIRVEGDNLKIRNALFWNNENGILCGNLKNVHFLSVKYSEFGFNGYGDGQSHGIYIGAIEKLIFEFNYVHHTKSGHHVKSRAQFSKIAYNYLSDHEIGNSSYAIDLQDGGKAIVIGNILCQSKFTENSALVHYGMPNSPAGQSFFIINNTVISDRHIGIFILNHSKGKAHIYNNLLVGKLDLVVGENQEKKNIFVPKSCFLPSSGRIFALTPDCNAINSGFIFTEHESEIAFVPEFEYIHPLSKKQRKKDKKIDVGAYELIW